MVALLFAPPVVVLSILRLLRSPPADRFTPEEDDAPEDSGNLAKLPPGGALVSGTPTGVSPAKRTRFFAPSSAALLL